MPGTPLETLEIEIKSESSDASAAIDNLIKSLDRLRTSLSGGLKAQAYVNGLKSITKAANAISADSGANLKSLASGITKLSQSMKTAKISQAFSTNLASLVTVAKKIEDGGAIATNLGALAKGISKLSTATADAKIASSLGNNLGIIASAVKKIPQDASTKLVALGGSFTGLSTASISPTLGRNLEQLSKGVKSLPTDFMAKCTSLATGLASLQTVSSITIPSSLTNGLNKLNILSMTMDGRSFRKFETLAKYLTPLSQLGKIQSMNTLANGIEKLVNTVNGLDSGSMQTFSQRMRQMADGLGPLIERLKEASADLQNLATVVNSVNRVTNQASTNGSGKNGFLGFITKHFGKIFSAERIGNYLSDAIVKSNEYTEDMNLFTVAMGRYAESAQQYANQVAEVMGIDPAEWMRNQGVFMTLTEGFGVATERAATMSKNLTQLGYDLASYYNMDVSKTMQKLQSGISGELEPLRRLGYDLSQTRLQATAAELQITKHINKMTQAEKAELRYYAIMKQVTQVQGDMARTLNSPANQMRIFKSQIEQLARSIGNVLIPAMNAIVPVATAIVKALRKVFDAIANLFGFQLPEVDYSGLNSAESSTEQMADNVGSAAKSAKEMLADFDELNVISSESGSGSGSGAGGLGDGFNWAFPTYDFLGDAVQTRVDELYNAIEPFITFVSDNIDKILIGVTAIGAGFLAWLSVGDTVAKLDKVKGIVQEIAGIAAVGARMALTVTMSAKLNQEWLETGDPSKFIEMMLTDALGTTVTAITAGKMLGDTAIGQKLGGKEGVMALAAGVTLAISAGVELVQNSEAILAEGVTAESILSNCYDALKLGAGAGLIAWSFTKNVSTSLQAASITGGIVLGVSSVLTMFKVGQAVAEEGFTTTNVRDAILGGLQGMASGALLGWQVAGPAGAAIGALIGASIAVGTMFAVKFLSDPTVDKASLKTVNWGDVTLAKDEIQTYVENMFTFDAQVQVKLSNGRNAINEAREDIEDSMLDLGAQANMIRLGSPLTEESAKAFRALILGDSKTGKKGLVGQIQDLLKSEEEQLKLTISVVPILDTSGMEISGSITKDVQDADKIINRQMSSIGNELARLTAQSYGHQLSADMQAQLLRVSQEMIELTAALNQSEMIGKYRSLTKFALSDMTAETYGQTMQTLIGYQNQMRGQMQQSVRESVAMLEGRLAFLETRRTQLADRGLDTSQLDDEIEAIKGDITEAVKGMDTTVNTAILNAFGNNLDSMFKEYEKLYGEVIANNFSSTEIGNWLDVSKYMVGQMSAETIATEVIPIMIRSLLGDDYDNFHLTAQAFGVNDWDLLGEKAQLAILQTIQSKMTADGFADDPAKMQAVLQDVLSMLDGTSTLSINSDPARTSIDSITASANAAGTAIAKLRELMGQSTTFSATAIPTVPVEQKAEGGYVDGDLFIANEAGPELVGRIGNRTAVANNDQIVASVSNGVRDANGEVVSVLGDILTAIVNQSSGSSGGSISPSASFGRFVQKSLDMYAGVTG